MKKHEQQSGQEGSPTEQIFAMRNIMDNQLETSDDIEIGRVADIEGEWRSDGKLILTSLITGPEALAGRFSARLRSLFHFFLRGRCEHCIPITEIDDFQPTLRLHGKATDYAVGQSDRWIANHIFRWIPGSGWRKWYAQQQAHQASDKRERQQRERKQQAAQPRRTHANQRLCAY